jgi:hydrogenase/urease accessory protein HupE
LKSRLLLVLLVVLLGPQTAGAHEVRPGYLELTETGANLFTMTWKVPALGAFHLAMEPRFPDFCHFAGEPTAMQTQGAFLERGRLRCDRAIVGSSIEIQGLDATVTNVLARVAFLDGKVQTALLSPRNPGFTVASSPGALLLVATYLQLGIEHILFGVDHLLFVLGLLLLAKDRWALVKTVTSFTIAHSITLALATFGYASLPIPPLNAAIALSILFLGPEIIRARRGETSLTIRKPWIVAFAFGLLHGFGFASGLRSMGLPQADVPLALLFFNLGVEAGQLAFVALMLLLERSFRVLDFRWPRAVQLLPAYAVGSLGAFWTIDRIVLMLGGGT